MAGYTKIRAEYDRLCGRINNAPSILRVTSTSNGLPTALSKGTYRVAPDVDCWLRQCNGTMTVATSNGTFFAGGGVEYIVAGTDVNVVGITDGATGDVWLTLMAG